MKSAHKLGVALATFILLSVVSYFIIKSLHEAIPKPQASGLGRSGNENATATSQQQEQVAASSVATSGVSTTGMYAGSSASGPGETPESTTTTTTTTTPPPMTTQTPSTTPIATSISSSDPTETTSIAPPTSKEEQTQTPTTTTTTQTSATTESVTTSEPTSTARSSSDDQGVSASALYDETTRRPLAEFPPSPDELEKWAQFKSKYMKAYRDQQAESERLSVFIGNLRFISAFNNLKDISFKLDVNRFADLTRNETNALFIGPAHIPAQLSAPDSHLNIVPDIEQLANRSVDWRHLLVEGGPVEQGNCLDSAIFALVASLESTLNAAASGNKTKLSEQQLIDCVSLHLAAANGMPPICSGRLSLTDILTVLENPAIKLSTFQDYHQFKLAVAAGQAPPNQCVAPAHSDTRPYVQSHVTVSHENIDEALQNSGPLVVALDASQPTFHFYKSGVYHDLQCSPDNLNFYALLVAHSTGPAQNDQQSGEPSYRIRASLGPDWGETGYMRLSSDPQRNKCGPQGVAIYPNIGFE